MSVLLYVHGNRRLIRDGQTASASDRMFMKEGVL